MRSFEWLLLTMLAVVVVVPTIVVAVLVAARRRGCAERADLHQLRRERDLGGTQA